MVSEGWLNPSRCHAGISTCEFSGYVVFYDRLRCRYVWEKIDEKEHDKKGLA